MKTGVRLDARFWIKGQPYSLENMLDFDEHTPLFDGGTVYQAFLSALSFHRWNSPVSGTIKKVSIVNGSYYLENLYEGFKNPQGADSSAPNDSQPFLERAPVEAGSGHGKKRPGWRGMPHTRRRFQRQMPRADLSGRSGAG